MSRRFKNLKFRNLKFIENSENLEIIEISNLKLAQRLQSCFGERYEYQVRYRKMLTENLFLPRLEATTRRPFKDSGTFMEGTKTKIRAAVKAAKTALWDSSSDEEAEDNKKKMKEEQKQQKAFGEDKEGLQENNTSNDEDSDNGWITNDDVVLAAEITADIMTFGIYGTVAECVDAVDNYNDRVKLKMKNENGADPQGSVNTKTGNTSEPKSKEKNDDDSGELIGEDEEELAADIVGNVLTMGMYGGIKSGIEAFDEWREERKAEKGLANPSSETVKKLNVSE